MRNTADKAEKKRAKSGKGAAPVLERERQSSRLTQTARRILSEAAHTLAREPVPRKQVKIPEPAMPLPGLDAGLDPAEIERLVEITDNNGNALAILAPEEALRQGLRFRMIGVILRTTKNKVLLSRVKDEKTDIPALWSLSLDFVRVGEAREDAAIRLLAQGAGLGGIRPRMVAATENSAAFAYDLTLYIADLPVGLLPGHAGFETLAVDKDEFEGLLKRAPDLFSEELRWAFATGTLFAESITFP